MENKLNSFIIKDIGRVIWSNGYLVRDYSCLSWSRILKANKKYTPVYPEIESFLDREEQRHDDKRPSVIDLITGKAKLYFRQRAFCGCLMENKKGQ